METALLRLQFQDPVQDGAVIAMRLGRVIFMTDQWRGGYTGASGH